MTEPVAQVPATQDPSATVPAAEPVPTTPAAQPAPAAPAAAPSQGRPWDNDLAFINEPGLRSQVSDYLAQTWQPHVTQIEQSSAQATELLTDFQTKPQDTFLDVADELFPEKAKAIREALGVETTPAAPATAQPTDIPAEVQRDPEVQALLDWKRSNDEKAAFDAEFERVQAAHPDLKFDRALYIAEVADQGDFDKAVSSYRTKGYSEYLTWKEAQAAAAAAATPPVAPATLGSSQVEGAASVETQAHKPTLHEALDNFFDRQEASGNSAAPPVPTG